MYGVIGLPSRKETTAELAVAMRRRKNDTTVAPPIMTEAKERKEKWFCVINKESRGNCL